MHSFNFVNIVNLMNDLLDPKNSLIGDAKNEQTIQSFEKGLYIREDDQDWGSAGMNDIQKDSQ